MIVNCPSCSSRYDMGGLPGDKVFSVTCRKCGHKWKELPYISTEFKRPRHVLNHLDGEEYEVARLVEAGRNAQVSFKENREKRIKNAGGWASLAVVAALPLALAGWSPATVVAAAPITISVYDKLGFHVNLYGLDIRHIEQMNRIVDGSHILGIKGEISNPTEDVRKIPSLRFTLLDDKGKEVYSWTLDTTARPLRPGETTSFTTRIAAPPEVAKNLQIRFAHQDEIGSNKL